MRLPLVLGFVALVSIKTPSRVSLVSRLLPRVPARLLSGSLCPVVAPPGVPESLHPLARLRHRSCHRVLKRPVPVRTRRLGQAPAGRQRPPQVAAGDANRPAGGHSPSPTLGQRR